MVRRSSFALSALVLLGLLVGACGDGGGPAPAVLGVSIDQGGVVLGVGESVELSVTVEAVGGASRDVEWASDDEGIATVSDAGVVSAVAVGEAVISATSGFDGSRSDSVSVTVEALGGGEVELVVGPDGGAVVTDVGVGVGVIPGTLVGELSVLVRRVVVPLAGGGRAGLPDGLVAVGDAFEVVSSETVLFSGREPVIVGFPIPAGADRDRLAVAMLLAVETVLGASAGEPHWSVVRGVVDADSGLFVVGLPVLPRDGVVLTLVEGDEVAPLGDAEVVRAGEGVLPWRASCEGFGLFNAETANCRADLPWIEARLAEIAQVYRDEGFSEPRVTIAGGCGLFGLWCTPVAHEVVVRWQDSRRCGEGSLGYYIVETGELTLCYGGSIVGGAPRSGGVSSEQFAREVLAHEVFHGVQYAYIHRIFHEAVQQHMWFLDGTATAVQRFVTGAGLVVTDMRNLRRRPISESLFAQTEDEEIEALVIEGLPPESRELLCQWLDCEYLAQDFWVFVLRSLDDGLVPLRGVLEAVSWGALGGVEDSLMIARAVSRGLVSVSEVGLSEWYWAYVRNKAFEQSVDLGRGAQACTPPAGESPERIVYGPGGSGNASFRLKPLSADVVGVYVGVPGGARIEVEGAPVGKLFVEGGSDCASPALERVAPDGGVMVWTLPEERSYDRVRVVFANPSIELELVDVRVTVSVAEEPVSVAVEPASVTLPVGGSQSFTATVTGADDASVTWDATCGSIDEAGNTVTYTAPAVVPPDGTCTITVTSDAEPSASAAATITVEDWTLDIRVGWGPGITDPDIVDVVSPWQASSSTVERSLYVIWPEFVVYVSLRHGDRAPAHDVPITITHDGRPLAGNPVYPAGAAWHVFYFFYGHPDYGAGTYEARATVDGWTLSASRVYTSSPLTAPSGVTVSPSGRLVHPPSHLDIAWSPAPGAVRYTAAGADITASLGWFDATDRASVTASATSARVGGVSIGWYRGRVTAFEWDPTLPRTQPYPEPVPATFRSATTYSTEGLEVGRRLAIDKLTGDAEFLGEDPRVGRIDIEPGGAHCLINTTDFFDVCEQNFADGEIVTLTYDGDASFGRDPTDLVAWGGDCAAFGSQPVCALTMHRDMEVSVEIDFR